MNVEPILEAAAFARPGYSLATFKQAALPVYLLTVRVLVLEKKPLSPIEEGYGWRAPTGRHRTIGTP